MIVRDTVRILLFDSSKRLLLMRVVNPSLADPSAPRLSGKALWATIGGRLEPGENLFAAAQRELKEETGIGEKSLEGAAIPVWHGEQILSIHGKEILLRETFVVMRTRKTELSGRFQTPEEKVVVQEMRWWTIDDLERTGETIVPYILRSLIRDASDGKYPDGPIEIDLSAAPVGS